MNVDASFDELKVFGRLSGNIDYAQKVLDNEVLKDCDEYVPFNTGNLRDSGIRGTRIGSGVVMYNTPYARRVYYGKGARTDKHPKATPQWFEKAKAVHKEKWLELVRKAAQHG